jgi:hypothetical protein
MQINVIDKAMKWVGKKLIWQKKWVNIDIFRNLSNHLMPHPSRRFKSYKLKKTASLNIYIE